LPSGNAPGMDSDFLLGATAISPDDIWAAGYAFSNADFVGHTLTLHYDGTSWSVVPSPDAGLGDLLYGVSASSSTDVWAVGQYADLDQNVHALTEHWDGTSWTVVPGADVGTGSFLFAVSSTPTGNAWAVGSYTTGGPSLALTDRWTGSRWKQIQGISPGTNVNQLHGVAALSDKSVFAVGWYTNGD